MPRLYLTRDSADTYPGDTVRHEAPVVGPVIKVYVEEAGSHREDPNAEIEGVE